MSNATDYDARQDPDRLEREIDEQRREIDETLRALEQKFSSREVAAQFMHYFGGPGREWASGLASSLKSNPMPSLLTGIGLVWLMMSDRTGTVRPHSYGSHEADKRGMFDDATSTARDAADAVREKAGELGDKAAHAGDALGEKVAHARDSLKSRAGNARHGIEHSADSVRTNFAHIAQEQPLALGAIGIALGALIGAALPRTAHESQVLGRTAERMKEKGKEMAQEAYAKVSEKVEEVAAVAGETLQRGMEDSKPQAENPA